MTLGLSLKWRIVISSVLLFALVGALFYFQEKFHVVSFLEWLDGLGAWAPILFILVEMVVVFILPGFGLILAQGLEDCSANKPCTVLSFQALPLFFRAHRLLSSGFSHWGLFRNYADYDHQRLYWFSRLRSIHPWLAQLFENAGGLGHIWHWPGCYDRTGCLHHSPGQESP